MASSLVSRVSVKDTALIPAEDRALLDKSFKRHYSGKYGKIYVDAASHVAYMVLTQPYIPIEDFKKMFNRVGKVVKDKKIQKLVFDKRLLKSFHQPSMEWYFVTWKTEMMAHGLAHHRKMLPPEPWFEQCVIAGRAEIFAKHPASPVHQLDIQYCKNLQEALNS